MTEPGDIIELRAAHPDGELACDFTIASEMARSGIRDDLAAGMTHAARRIGGGVEVPFRPDAEATVMRYVELESRCCSFLSLAVERRDDVVLLRVTGRDEAQPLIEQLFAGGTGVTDKNEGRL